MTDKVLDFNAKRKENIEKKRRSFERLMFENFLGSYSVVDDEGSLYQIKLVDISHKGCLFEVPWNKGSKKPFKKGDDLTLRMYFTQKEYLPVLVKMKYSKEVCDDSGQESLRYGCEFDRGTQSFEAFNMFIEFLYKFAEHSTEDRGQSKKVYFI